jgi:hypothetical protein
MSRNTRNDRRRRTNRRRRGRRIGLLDYWQNLLDDTYDFIDDSIDRVRDDDEDLEDEVDELKDAVLALNTKIDQLIAQKATLDVREQLEVPSSPAAVQKAAAGSGTKTPA